jgi:ABC-type nitrate/sulfonate/bicarbonate transport system permease component
VAHLESSGKRRAPAIERGEQLNGLFSSSAFFRGSLDDHWLSILSVVGLLAAWEGAALLGLISTLFFPPPSLIVQTLIKLLSTAEFWASLGMTVFRLVSGMAIGASGGLLLGWLMGANRPVRVAFDPLLAALHPIPKLAIYPIFLILLGVGELSKITLISIAAFFPVVLNTLSGVQHIDRKYWEVAENFGSTPLLLLRRVILPGSLPMALTGLRLAFNNALVVGIAIEMLSAREGLGAMIWMAWQTLRTEELYATLTVIAAIGITSNLVMHKVVSLLTPWNAAQTNNRTGKG